MDKEKIIEKLTQIFDLELSGVIRYTHYSLMIRSQSITIG